MKHLTTTNCIALLAFSVCAAYSVYKKLGIDAFIAANEPDLSESTVLAFKACSSAWVALTVCAGVAAAVVGLNLLRNQATSRGRGQTHDQRAEKE